MSKFLNKDTEPRSSVGSVEDLLRSPALANILSEDSCCDRIYSSLSLLSTVLAMVKWEISQWLGKNIVWNW